MRFINRITQGIREFSSQGLSSSEIAFGIAIGIFIAFVPMIGVHTIMAIGAAYLLRLNPAVVFLGTQISNPISFPFQIFVSAQAGSLLLRGSLLEIQFSKDIGVIVSYYLVPLLVGSLILGIITSLLSFILIKRFFRLRRASG